MAIRPALFTALALSLAAGAAHAQTNLVVNGGFETGDFSGWTQFGDIDFDFVEDFLPHTGVYGAFFGAIEGSGIQQTIALHTGDVVEVGYWYDSFLGDVPNSILVTLGSVQVSSLTNVTDFDYVHVVTTVTVAQDNPVLRLRFSDPNDYINIDDITLTVTSTGGGTCGTADFNGDGDVGTDSDIESFFRCLAGTCCASCFVGGADFNGDGDVGTDADIEAFFRVLAGNPC